MGPGGGQEASYLEPGRRLATRRRAGGERPGGGTVASNPGLDRAAVAEAGGGSGVRAGESTSPVRRSAEWGARAQQSRAPPPPADPCDCMRARPDAQVLARLAGC